MKLPKLFLSTILVSLGFLGLLPSARAAITPQGDVAPWAPSHPLNWTSSTYGYVGNTASGTLTVDSGSTLTSGTCSIGNVSSAPGLVMVSGPSSTWANSNYLYVGKSGRGVLNVTHGGSVSNTCCYLGFYYVASGTATVDGPGSKWANNSELYVGLYGNGRLNVTHGGTVSNTYGNLAFYSGSSTATVNGPSSMWVNSNDLGIGIEGTGTLSILQGGAVTAGRVSINSSSLLAVDVGGNSLLTVGGGAGTLTNRGTVRILAGAGVPVNNSIKYSPISAGTWSGTGTYQAVGGTWDAALHQFTASSVVSGAAGTSVSIDTASIQRALIEDDIQNGGTGWTVGASFLAAGSATNIAFTATPISGQALADLKNALVGHETISGGWTFSTTNYAVSSNNPIYLSIEVGAISSTDDLKIWSYGSSWTQINPIDLTYDGRYASFTATSLSGYAATVPEPCTLILLLAAAMGWSIRVWRRRKHTSERI